MCRKRFRSVAMVAVLSMLTVVVHACGKTEAFNLVQNFKTGDGFIMRGLCYEYVSGRDNPTSRDVYDLVARPIINVDTKGQLEQIRISKIQNENTGVQDLEPLLSKSKCQEGVYVP